MDAIYYSYELWINEENEIIKFVDFYTATIFDWMIIDQAELCLIMDTIIYRFFFFPLFQSAQDYKTSIIFL